MAVRQRRPARRPMSGRLLGAGLLILLALFTTAVAAGSRNLTIFLFAFVLFGGGVALLTQERIRNKLRRTPRDEPRNPPNPVEEFVAEFRSTERDDEEEEESAEDGLASIDDLEASFADDEEELEREPDLEPPSREAEVAEEVVVAEPAERAEAPAPAVPKQRQPAWDPKPQPEDRNDRYTAAGHVEELGGPLDDSRAFVSEETFLPAASVRDVAATLVVADIERSVEFYTGLLGLVELDRSSEAVLLEAGFGRVLLVRRRDDTPERHSPLMHLALEVSDVDNAYLQLQDRGVVFSHGPRAAITGGTYEVVAASFTDPDGHGLAITEIREL
ncbi:VOC family protein [Phytomonospora sp. NPDC050363]|uniref:VOC family protein n=1 Tax=Phytomonospora sp. NPDC050363 TaxID=3155642 RepID=UPI0033EC492B